MKNLLTLSLSAILIVSCAMEETSNEVAEPLDGVQHRAGIALDGNCRCLADWPQG